MTVTINLLPWREERKEQQKREFFSILGLAIIVAFGLMLFIHMMIARQINFQEDINLYLKNEIHFLDGQIAQIKQLEEEKKKLLAKMEVIQQLQASRPEIVRLFDGIVRIVPSGLFLTNLSRVGSVVEFDGKAESNTRVSTLMRNIESSDLLTKPTLTVIQADDQSKPNANVVTDRLIEFNLQAIEVASNRANEQALPSSDPEQPAIPDQG